jgi:phosphate transport system substrate-binding protein
MNKLFCMIASVTAALALCAATATATAGNLVIKGSTTVLPISQIAVENYMKAHPDVNISLSGGGSSNGIKAIIDGSTDLANASRFIKDKEVAMARTKGVYPVPFAVAYDAIIPIVHPSNNLTGITLAQLKEIYMGKITNFKAIGGPDLKIVICSRDTSSGTYETWEGKVMNKARVTPRAQMMASNGAVAQAVSSNKNAIGYIGIGYLNSGVKPLKVDGVEGTKESTLNGTYPISRPLFMFTNGWPKGDVLNFVNYMLNPEKGQKAVEKAGYVPLY